MNANRDKLNQMSEELQSNKSSHIESHRFCEKRNSKSHLNKRWKHRIMDTHPF